MEIKEGRKTSEFYLTLIPMALLFLNQVFGVDLDEGILTEGILGAVSAITAGFYIYGRVQLKLRQMRLSKANPVEDQ